MRVPRNKTQLLSLATYIRHSEWLDWGGRVIILRRNQRRRGQGGWRGDEAWRESYPHRPHRGRGQRGWGLGVRESAPPLILHHHGDLVVDVSEVVRHLRVRPCVSMCVCVCLHVLVCD